MNYIQRVILILGIATFLNECNFCVNAYPIQHAVLQLSDARIKSSAREKTTSDVDQSLEQARAAYFKEQYQRSEQIYRQIIEKFPNNEAAHLGLGDALSRQNWLSCSPFKL